MEAHGLVAAIDGIALVLGAVLADVSAFLADVSVLREVAPSEPADTCFALHHLGCFGRYILADALPPRSFFLVDVLPPLFGLWRMLGRRGATGDCSLLWADASPSRWWVFGWMLCHRLLRRMLCRHVNVGGCFTAMIKLFVGCFATVL